MRRWGIFAFALLLVGACSTSCGSGAPTSGVSPLETPGTMMQVSPPATPTISTIMSPPTPSSSEVGTVVGFLLEGGETPQPMGQAVLYLGEVVTLADGTPAMAKLDRQTAPSTQTDANGWFVFTEAPVGQHTLFLDIVTRSIVLHHPSSGGDFLIEVEGGAITDLGELVYLELPSRP